MQLKLRHVPDREEDPAVQSWRRPCRPYPSGPGKSIPACQPIVPQLQTSDRIGIKQAIEKQKEVVEKE